MHQFFFLMYYDFIQSNSLSVKWEVKSLTLEVHIFVLENVYQQRNLKLFLSSQLPGVIIFLWRHNMIYMIML